jgi:hypothetical protein
MINEVLAFKKNSELKSESFRNYVINFKNDRFTDAVNDIFSNVPRSAWFLIVNRTIKQFGHYEKICIPLFSCSAG